MTDPLQSFFQAQKIAHRQQGVPDVVQRKQRLQHCINLLVENREELCEAINEDFGGRSEHYTLMSDILLTVEQFKYAIKQLPKWMKTERRSAPFPLGLFGGRARINYQPKGVVGIMVPWNYPINLAFGPLCDALAAGNRAMIKPSEFTPETSELMAKLVARYFEPDEVTVVTGGPEVGAAFSALPFDHLLFTGATRIGRRVMTAAAQNLTPVTLELGGKSPVIISTSANIIEAADKVITGKATNAGQICVAPDYVFVPEQSLQTFLDRAHHTFTQQYPNPCQNPDYASVINQRHYERIHGYLNQAVEAGAQVIPLSDDKPANGNRKLPLHLIVNPAETLDVMQEEIFGPVLVVKTYQQLQESIDYINDRPNPLAMYYFGKDDAEQERVLDQTLSGGVTLNDVIMHIGCHDIPFGGVGESGMGSYHGHEGFKTFSHARAVYKQGFVNPYKLMGAIPPYGDKLKKTLEGQLK